MILVFDVGNTETTVGLFDGESLAGHWRLMTAVERTPDEFGVLIRALLASNGVEPGRVTGVAIGSVVPGVTTPLAESAESWLGCTATLIDGASTLPIRLDVDEPSTVGADRIINTLAACRLYARDTIVVDLGTATTYDCITADGVFLGGIIQPGVSSSAETLFRRTSKLPATELVPPRQVIGKRTEECIRAGVLFGAADSIDGIVRRLKGAWPRAGEPYVVATGGLAAQLRPYCTEIAHIEPHLTLIGLQMAHAILTAGTKA
ncbi:MAG TPA: type III pantothenate kinase [Gemmatimonadaceae bacterium]|nr:type III pantothenate kinase [Gemmatimonadaceae bacterium]